MTVIVKIVEDRFSFVATSCGDRTKFTPFSASLSGEFRGRAAMAAEGLIYRALLILLALSLENILASAHSCAHTVPKAHEVSGFFPSESGNHFCRACLRYLC